MARVKRSTTDTTPAALPATTPATHAPVPAATRAATQVRHPVRSATTAADAEVTSGEVHAVRFQLVEAIAYHAIREQFLARLNRLLTGLQVFLGTSAIAGMTDLVPFSALVPLVASALAGVLLLVIDPAGGAREHRGLRSRLHNVLADIEEATVTGELLRLGRGKMQRIAADAPPAYRCVQAMAYNTAVNATYDEETAVRHRYVVGRWQRLCANWSPMRGFQFKRNLISG
ncbi:hypothetical protein [Mesorhizobium sp. LNHC209A00]|uniref:hypothetical protein n=1 Tax=Mesorhizobium TaxID=68287 RepID=UPI0003CFD1DE|nr:hypothetical protein [Mesorhizobium sp. LNHC209A00]ESY92707.1 hypothetical protein X738_26780 [Mesorhizobium sp. LNHC209A00]